MQTLTIKDFHGLEVKVEVSKYRPPVRCAGSAMQDSPPDEGELEYRVFQTTCSVGYGTPENPFGDIDSTERCKSELDRRVWEALEQDAEDRREEATEWREDRRRGQ